MAPTRKQQLELENERLRQEVDELRRIVYPPPPEPEPEPPKEPERHPVYMLGREDPIAKRTQHVLASYVERNLPDAKVIPVFRVDDVPVGGEVITQFDVIELGWGRSEHGGPRVFIREKDGLRFTPSRPQTSRFLDLTSWIVDLCRDIVAECERLGPTREGHRLSLTVEVLLAHYRVLEATFNAGKDYGDEALELWQKLPAMYAEGLRDDQPSFA